MDLGRDIGRLGVSAWTGEHPVDGSDVAHIMLYPATDTDATRMPQVASVLGLRRGQPEMVGDDMLQVVLGDVVVRLTMPAAGLDITTLPRDPVWSRAALGQGFVILTLAVDPWDGELAELDAFISRHGRNVFMGMVRVGDPGQESHVDSPGSLGLADLATVLPTTSEDEARLPAITAAVRAFFQDQAESGRSYAMADIGPATGIGPAEAFVLMRCLADLAAHGDIEPGPTGDQGPTWRRRT